MSMPSIISDTSEVLEIISRTASPASQGTPPPPPPPSNAQIQVQPLDSTPPPPPPPPSSAIAVENTTPTTTVAAAPPSALTPAPSIKPKSKAPAQRSPSPLPPAPPPPRTTIRLEINLGGPDNYEVDIAKLSKDSGQLPATPPPSHISDQESEGEDDNENDVKDVAAKITKRGRKAAGQEYYDIHDPFIDDSELAIDERTHMAQTKQKGFYVSAGEVQLLKDKSVNSKITKSPSKLKPQSAIIANRDKSPLSLRDGSEEDTKLGGKKRGSEELFTNGRKKRRVEGDQFSPELDIMLAELKRKIDLEDWGNKGKFPPSIKPFLAQVALQAIKNGEYDDTFFALMPKLFPYNKFTMTKLIKRLVFQDHYNWLMKLQEDKLVELKQVSDEGFERAQEEWERSVLLWEKRVQRAKDAALDPLNGVLVNDGEDAEMPPATQDGQGAADDPLEVDADGKEISSTLSGLAINAKDTHPPPKKYRMTDRIRQILWDLVQLSNESVKITNEKNNFENKSEVVSEQGVRKTLYQKILLAFPEGWMNSGNISREVSAIKKKLEKEEE